MKKKKASISSVIILIIVLVIAVYDNLKEENVNSSNNENEIVLERCIDGDTAVFSKIGKTRFLFIDTPESTTKKEKYGKEASKFTCSALENAKVITYEYDGNKTDRYDRTLAWIFVDGKLLQEMIAKEGYVKKFYDYKKEYKYERLVRESVNDKYHIFEGD